MIARVFLYLPFKLVTSPDTSLATISIADKDMQVTIYPPQQFLQMDGLFPKLQIPAAESSKYVYNDRPTAEMDVLVVEVRGENLDRSPSVQSNTNPTLALAVKHANEVLRRLRTFTQNPAIRQADGPAFLVFLDESGEIVSSDPPNVRLLSRAAQNVILRNVVVDENIWNKSAITTPPLLAHRDLLLDAFALYPEPACLTLAFTALEAVAKLTIRTLAQTVHPPSLGEWLSEHFKEPRIANMIKGVIAGLSGVRLQDDPIFWGSLNKLIEVRNSVVHDGVAAFKQRPLDKGEIQSLLDETRMLIMRLEDLASIAPPDTWSKEGKMEISSTLSDWRAPLVIRTGIPN